MVLLNFSNLPWIPHRLKRNQAIFIHLLDSCSSLSSGVYANPPTLAGHGLAKYASPLRFSPQPWRTPGGKPVTILDSSYTLWDWHFSAFRRHRSRRMATYLRHAAAGSPFFLWLNTAGRLQSPVASLLLPAAAKSVFDLSDDFRAAGFGMAHQDLADLTTAVQLVLCVNDTVASSVPHSRKLVFHNATDPAAFSSHNPAFRLHPWWPKPPGAVYIGFTGGIHWTRTDLPLLEKLLLRFPQWRFLFVGYSDGPRILEWLARFPNAAFVPEIPYTDLTHVLHSFDVAIVPHADNEYTRGNDLLKVLEYFAAGVPVVATPCSGLERYGNALSLTADPDAFANRLTEIVANPASHDPAPGLRIASQRSWPAQVRSLAHSLDLV